MPVEHGARESDISPRSHVHMFRTELTSQVVWHLLRVSISILLRVIAEKRIVTSDDLSVTPIIGFTRIITNGVSGYDLEKIGWFRLAYAKREAFYISP